MPDAPDWYYFLPYSKRHILQDMGELAVRLGSTVSFDRRGIVMDMDDFETGLSKWGYDGYASDSAQKVVVTHVYRGGYAIQLNSGKLADPIYIINKAFPNISAKKSGAEIAFRPSSGGYYQIIRLQHSDGSALSQASIKLDMVAKEIYYLNSGGNYASFGTIPDLGAMTTIWNVIKLVADFENETYYRVILNGTTYDLSSYALYQTSPSANPYVQFLYGVYGDGVTQSVMLVDAFIYTIEEP